MRMFACILPFCLKLLENSAGGGYSQERGQSEGGSRNRQDYVVNSAARGAVPLTDWAFETFALNASTSLVTRFCCCSVRCGNMGKETISAATRDATGKSSRV